MGVRGLRLGMMLREDLLDTQLEALSLAYKQTQGDLWVMAPMVATVEDAQYFVDKARSYGLPKVGVMIEVPSAAICSEQILSVADFASLGTNDLSQYTMASDRTQGELAAYLNIWQRSDWQICRRMRRGRRRPAYGSRAHRLGRRVAVNGSDKG